MTKEYIPRTCKFQIKQTPKQNKLYALKKTYFCSICSKRFKQKYVYLSHMKLHTKQNLYICDYCRKGFNRKSSLIYHIRKHTLVDLIPCRLCDKKFTVTSKLILHMRNHTGIKDFKCDICNKKFTDRYALKIHYQIHFGKQFVCHICGKEFNKNFSLMRHILIHDPIKVHRGDKRFYQKLDLDAHTKLHSKKFLCDNCGKGFKRKNSLIIHLRIHGKLKNHPKLENVENNDDIEMKIDEGISKKDVFSKINLGPFNTQGLVLDMKSTPPSFENIDFLGKKDPQLNERTDFKENRKHNCLVCHRTYKNKKSLILHQKIHTSDVFRCYICGKPFTVASKYESHVLSHTGVKQYTCEVCEKKFTAKSSLEMHQKIHEGIRPYKCVYCDKRESCCGQSGCSTKMRRLDRCNTKLSQNTNVK